MPDMIWLMQQLLIRLLLVVLEISHHLLSNWLSKVLTDVCMGHLSWHFKTQLISEDEFH